MIEAIKVINGLKKEGLIKDYAIGGGTEKEFSDLYAYFRSKRYKLENVYIVINGLPVQFLPSYIHSLFEEAIKRAKRIKIKGVPAKFISIEYLIATLLMAFRPKDRLVIPQLLEQVNVKLLNDMLQRFSDEKTPLDKRLRRILESIQ